LGDQRIYDFTITVTSSHGSELSTQTQTREGTITSVVTGMNNIEDGFGYTREALEVNNKYVTNYEYGGATGEITTISNQYFDVNSKQSIMADSHLNTSYGMMGMSYEMSYDYLFYNTGKMNEYLSATYASGGYAGLSTFAPTDVVSSFEGKKIKKGDSGKITIGSVVVNWEALGTETIKGYKCLKIRFSSTLFQTNTTDVDISYVVWLTDSFPTLIKLVSVIETTTETTMGGMLGSETYSSESKMEMSMILSSSASGTTSISWGDETGVEEPSENKYGEYDEWSKIPSMGSKNTVMTYSTEEAILYAEGISANLSSYLTNHTEAYVAVAQYTKSDVNETWTFTYRDETTKGYEIKTKYNGINKSVVSEESKTYDGVATAKTSLSTNFLTFSGNENIINHYSNYSSQNINVIFVADINSFLSQQGSTVTDLGMVDDMYPTSSYMTTIGDMLSGEYITALVDAENGQLTMLMEMSTNQYQ